MLNTQYLLIHYLLNSLYAVSFGIEYKLIVFANNLQQLKHFILKAVMIHVWNNNTPLNEIQMLCKALGFELSTL